MPCTSPEKPRGRAFKKNLLHLIAVLFVGTTIGVLYSMGHIHAWLQNMDVVRDWILQHGIVETLLIFFVANTLLCAFGLPRLWTSAFAGIVFGGPLGFCISLPSSVIGAGLTFAFARMIGSRRLLEMINTKWKVLAAFSTPPDMLQTILIRQIPVPGMVSTLLLAVSNVSVPVFIIASAIGFVPGTAIACFLGDTVTSQQTRSSITTATVIILVSLLVMMILRRKRTEWQKGSPAERI